MTMTFVNQLCIVSLAGQRIGINLTRIQSQTHRTAQILNIKLFRHQVDNRMCAVRIELRAVGISHTANVTGKFNYCALHAQADTEERNLVLTCILNSLNLALNTAVTEAAGHQNAVNTGHNLSHISIICFDFFCIYPMDIKLGFIGNCCMTQGFGNGNISILQSNVFADYSDSYLLVIFFQDAGHHIMPALHILRLVLHFQLAQDNGIKSLLLHEHRYLINASCGKVLNNCVGVYVAEHSHFFAHFLRDRLFAAANDNIRRNTDAAQLFDAVLSRFGFQLTGCGNIRYQRNMNIKHIVLADILFYLTDGFQKRQAFNITYSTADFRNNEVGIILLAYAENALFDFICDMRNNLYGTAKIIATAFFIYYTLVNLACGRIGVFGQVDINKAFVMSQVKVSFRTVVGYKNLAMLIRAHCSRVNIDIRVELLDSNPIAAAFQQTA